MLSLTGAGLLTDILPTSSPHNVAAKILRQGVAISAFASLEKYLEARVDAIIQRIPSSAIAGAALGDDLRYFLSGDAVIGLANRVNFAEKSARQNYIDTKLALLSQYSAVPATYTSLGFSPRGPNVSEGDVSRALSVFTVDKPWKRLGDIARDLGSTRLNLKDDFVNLSKTRHRAAHEPGSNIPTADLKTHVETTILIAACFDCMAETITRALASATNFNNFKAIVAATTLSYRFVDEEVSGTWVERTSDGTKVLKRHASEQLALSSAASRGGTAIVVARDTQSVPLAIA